MWKPGQSGNPKGRAKGSRNKEKELRMRLIGKTMDEFEDLWEGAKKESPLGALKLIVGMFPKDVHAEVQGHITYCFDDGLEDDGLECE